jgi:predicted RND superfamily exporter protein
MDKLYKYPALIAGSIAVITVFFAVQLPRAELDNNNIRFLPEGNQAKFISEYIDETFGGQVMILVGLERPYRTVFEKEFLEQIRVFAQAAEKIDLVKSVNSIMSTQYITGDGDSIIVSDLVPEDFSGTQEEIAELRRRIASWDLFRGSLVSDDLSAAQIIITLDVLTESLASPEVSRCYETIHETADNVFSGMAEVYFAGQPVVNAVINKSIIADNVLLIPLVVIVVLALLFFSFRRFTYVALPLLTVIIAVVWTVGMAALFGIKLSILTTLLPVILVAVGSAYGIHIVTHYAQDTRNKTLSAEEHRALVLDLMRKLFKPVGLAALTTLAGFISFCFTPIIPMREFGYCASVGVFAAFVMAVLFIPSMFLLRGPKADRKSHEETPNDGLQARRKEHTESDRFSAVIAHVFLGVAKKRKLVLFFAILTVFISIYGLSKVVIDNAVIEFFQNETDMSRSDRFIREYFGGSKDINIIFEADTSEEILHPAVLQAVDSLSFYLGENVPAVGKVVGFTDIIKRINQVFNVDEAPEGLRPVSSASGNSGGDDFGFGSFGFGDFNSGGAVTEESPKEIHDLTKYSAADLLRFLDSAAGKSYSLSGSDLVRELKRLTNYDGMAYYEIPANPARYGKTSEEELGHLISNYLVPISGNDEMLYSNDPFEPTSIRTMVQIRATGSKEIREITGIINEYVKVNFPPNVRVMIGGGAMQEIAITELIFNSQIISVFISVLMVFFIITFSNKSPVAGIIAAAPLTLAILCNFAVMGFLGIKLNLGTALISSLAVGIGIDYTIHFIEFFRREYIIEEKGFLRRTFIGCGKAILINALSVGAGFGVLAFSQFRIIAELGALIALSMLITALVSLTVIPALLSVIKPKFIFGKKNHSGYNKSEE